MAYKVETFTDMNTVLMFILLQSQAPIPYSSFSSSSFFQFSDFKMPSPEVRYLCSLSAIFIPPVYRGYIVFAFSVRMSLYLSLSVCLSVNSFFVKDFSGTTLT